MNNAGTFDYGSTPVQNSCSFDLINNDTFSVVYTFQHHMKNVDTTWANIKRWRIRPPNSWPDATADALGIQEGTGFQAYNEDDTGNPGRLFQPNGGASTGVWHTDEDLLRYQDGNSFTYFSNCGDDGHINSPVQQNCSASTTTGVYFHYENGKLMMHNESWRNPGQVAGGRGIPSWTDLRVFDNFEDQASLPHMPSGSQVFMSDLYVSTTWARVMVTTSSTLLLSAGSKRDIWIMTSRTNTSITCSAHFSTFSANDTAYLYVFDSSNNVNANGFVLTVGASSGTGNTNLSPAVTGVTTSSFSVSYTSAGPQYQVAMATSNDFATPLSSGILTIQTTTYIGLNSNTTYWFEVKVATEGDSSYTNVSTMTLIIVTPAGGGGNQHLQFQGTFNLKGITLSGDLIYEDGEKPHQWRKNEKILSHGLA